MVEVTTCGLPMLYLRDPTHRRRARPGESIRHAYSSSNSRHAPTPVRIPPYARARQTSPSWPMRPRTPCSPWYYHSAIVLAVRALRGLSLRARRRLSTTSSRSSNARTKPTPPPIEPHMSSRSSPPSGDAGASPVAAAAARRREYDLPDDREHDRRAAEGDILSRRPRRAEALCSSSRSCSTSLRLQRVRAGWYQRGGAHGYGWGREGGKARARAPGFVRAQLMAGRG